INWPHYPLQARSRWREHYAESGLDSPRDKYAAFVSETDELLGRMLDQLEARGVRENTIVVFQSDHGHSVEERTFHGGGSAGPYRGHKGSLFEGGLRVPSIVSWPQVLPQGETREQFVTGLDWYPTLAALTQTQIAPEHHLDGQSIVPVIESNDAPSPHQEMYWRLGGNPKTAKWAVRQGDWKLLGKATENVRPADALPLTSEDKKLFLVNLETDIGERHNLARQQPERVKSMLRLRDKYEADIEATQDTP
ncbi:MAG: sulfatase-like hydrolase/transferase, partial [Planctomycetota bacterium]